MSVNLAIVRWMATLLLLCTAVCRAGTFSPELQLRQMRVVVSARSLQPHGRSHWHLYLYDGTGRLIRQLTRGRGFDYVNPVFSPDGKSIAFVRMPAKWRNDVASREAELFLMRNDGTRARRWPAEAFRGGNLPSWWHTPNPEIKWGSDDTVTSSGVASACCTTDTVHSNSRTYRDPTGRFELVLKNAEEMTSESCVSGSCRTFWLRKLHDGSEVEWSEMSGATDLAEWMTDTMWVRMENGSPWISIPPLLTSIWVQHISSTDGSLILAVDPEAGALRLISQHGADFLRLPGLPALVLLNYGLYEAAGEGKTGNCLSLDLWDARFQRHVLSPRKPVFGGASFFQPERRTRNDSVHSVPMEWKGYDGKAPF